MLKKIFKVSLKRILLLLVPLIILVLGIFTVILSSFATNSSTELRSKAMTPNPVYSLAAQWKSEIGIKIRNTSSVGIEHSVIKIKLNDSNFNFSKAKPNGEDIHIVDGSTLQPIPFQVYSWLHSIPNGQNQAEILVRINSIPPTSTRLLYLFYENPNATSKSSTDESFTPVIENGIIVTIVPNPLGDLRLTPTPQFFTYTPMHTPQTFIVSLTPAPTITLPQGECYNPYYRKGLEDKIFVTHILTNGQTIEADRCGVADCLPTERRRLFCDRGKVFSTCRNQFSNPPTTPCSTGKPVPVNPTKPSGLRPSTFPTTFRPVITGGPSVVVTPRPSERPKPTIRPLKTPTFIQIQPTGGYTIPPYNPPYTNQ